MGEPNRLFFIVILSPTNDNSLKQFQALTKNQLHTNSFIYCPFHQALDLAFKAKPPLVKIATPDFNILPGESVPIVLKNWLGTQLKKPVQKAAPIKKPPVTSGKKNPALKSQTIEVPMTPPKEPEPIEPFFVILYDFPKTESQVRSMMFTSYPALCHITVDYPVVEVDNKKGGTQTGAIFEPRPFLNDQLPTLDIKFQPGSPNVELAEQCLRFIISNFNLYLSYQKETLEIRYITIPPYPKPLLAVPQLPLDKLPSKAAVVKGAQPPVVEQLPDIGALNKAYCDVFHQTIEQFLLRCQESKLNCVFQRS